MNKGLVLLVVVGFIVVGVLLMNNSSILAIVVPQTQLSKSVVIGESFKPSIQVCLDVNSDSVTNLKITYEVYDDSVTPGILKTSGTVRDGGALNKGDCSQVVSPSIITTGWAPGEEYHLVVYAYENGKPLGLTYSAFDNVNNPQRLNGGGVAWGFKAIYPLPTCTPGWDCKDSSYRAYKNSDCSWTNEQFCDYGCGLGVCKTMSNFKGSVGVSW